MTVPVDPAIKRVLENTTNPASLQNILTDTLHRLEQNEIRDVGGNQVREFASELGDLDHRAVDDEGNLRLIMSAINLLNEFGINGHFAGFNVHGKPQFYFSADDGSGVVADGLVKFNIDGITYAVDGVFLQAGTEPETGYALRSVDDGGIRSVDDGGYRAVFDPNVSWNWTFIGTLYHNAYSDSVLTRLLFGNHGFTLSGDLLFGKGGFETGEIEGAAITGTPTISTDAPSGDYSVSVDKDNFITFEFPVEYGKYYLLMIKVKSDTNLRLSIVRGGTLQMDLPIVPGKWVKYPVMLQGSTIGVFKTCKVSIKSGTSGVPALVDDIRVYKVYGFSNSASIRSNEENDFSQYSMSSYDGIDSTVDPFWGEDTNKNSLWEVNSRKINFWPKNAVSPRDYYNLGHFRINNYKPNLVAYSYQPKLNVTSIAETDVADIGTNLSPMNIAATGTGVGVHDHMLELTLLCRAPLLLAVAKTVTFKIYAGAQFAPVWSLIATLPAYAIPATIGNYMLELKAYIAIDSNDRSKMLTFARVGNEAAPKYYSASGAVGQRFKITATLSSVASFSLWSQWFEAKYILQDVYTP